jgi:hypothetical protein
MMSPTLQPLHDAALASFVQVLKQDSNATNFRNLLDTVQELCKFVAALGLAMIQTYVDVRLGQAKASRPECSCGKAMQWHAASEWLHGTQFGNVCVKDVYAYCRGCRKSARPLHGWIGTDMQRWSLPLEEKLVDLASDESCGKAVAKLFRQHAGIEVGRTSALRMLHKHGKMARTFINDKLAEARSVVELPPALRPEGSDELEVQFDGGMIPVATLETIEVPEGKEPERSPVRGLPKRRRECRWEEVKLGLVQKPGCVERLYSVQPTAGLDQSFDDMFSIACMQGLCESTQVRGISDGARHIRLRMEDTFHSGDFRFILDRPHCKEHLSSAGEALESMTSVPAQEWAGKALKKLETGEVAAVIAELKQAWLDSGPDKKSRNDTLRLEAGYFERNHDAVEYAFYRDQGWSTASSEIESGHRHIVQVRVKISGAWWHPDHVDDILALRMLKANGWWHDYWQQQCQRWRQRADEFRTMLPRTKLALVA